MFKLLFIAIGLAIAGTGLFVLGGAFVVCLVLGLIPSPVKQRKIVPVVTRQPQLITDVIKDIEQMIKRMRTDNDEMEVRIAISNLNINYFDDLCIEQEVERLKNALEDKMLHVRVNRLLKV